MVIEIIGDNLAPENSDNMAAGQFGTICKNEQFGVVKRNIIFWSFDKRKYTFPLLGHQGPQTMSAKLVPNCQFVIAQLSWCHWQKGFLGRSAKAGERAKLISLVANYNQVPTCFNAVSGHVSALDVQRGKCLKAGKVKMQRNLPTCILNSGLAGWTNPQMIWNFPQRDCLGTGKLSSLQWRAYIAISP